MLYCTYDMLNMFRAILWPSSGVLDCMCVITSYGVQCLVAGCRGSGAGDQAMRPGRRILRVAQHPSSWCHSLLLYTWPPTTSNQALHTIGGNNTHIVSSSWWWVYKCPKHVEPIISAINHSVASIWFFFSTRGKYLPAFRRISVPISSWSSSRIYINSAQKQTCDPDNVRDQPGLCTSSALTIKNT